ncbi:MAG: hypothetical protein AAB354_06790, partial [candidate division KSB1 bacterium]
MRCILAALVAVIFFFALTPNKLCAQRGRANGIGLRASYWSVGNQAIRWSSTNQQSAFEIAGVGGWLNYFSRVSDHWYLDFNLGAIARVKGDDRDSANADVQVSVLVPFLFGARYDLLPTRVSSAFQPYLAAGFGPYWNNSLQVRN